VSQISGGSQHGAASFEIRLKGHLDVQWSAWFSGLTITNESDGTTIIHAPALDQAALYGLLQKIRDVGMPLVSVTRIDPDPTNGTTPSLTEGKEND
jgi:hypothetical protein